MGADGWEPDGIVEKWDNTFPVMPLKDKLQWTQIKFLWLKPILQKALLSYGVTISVFLFDGLVNTACKY